MKAYSGRELVRLLREHGWQVARVEGSHHIMVHPNHDETLSVPVHGSKALKLGLLHALLRAAGIKPE